jgi:8-oxo-dGTP pyrophosphatase MutT (NUDIX family)
MEVVYAREPFPDAWSSAIFLAGPTPRSGEVKSWRPEALAILARLGFDGVVFVPEDRSGEFRGDYTDQVEWERDGLRFADHIVFWIPRDLDTLPGFTTNVEFGVWASSDKAILGHPPHAPKNRYLDWLAGERDIPIHLGLEEALRAAIARDRPARREGGERHVPQQVWHTPMFQSWYGALRKAGNRLDGAEVLWQFRVAWNGQRFAWIMRVRVWIAAEQRHKKNEWVFARSDVSTVVLHRPRPEPLDTEIVLVREYRAPARTSDGFVHELPGGSAPEGGEDPRHVAADEVREETGLVIAGERLRPLGARQLVATLSSHVAHAYAVEITEEELALALALAAAETPHGAGGSERTVVEVTTLRALLSDARVDWCTLGIVARALMRGESSSDERVAGVGDDR